jgi:hypothetical protein
MYDLRSWLSLDARRRSVIFGYHLPTNQPNNSEQYPRTANTSKTKAVNKLKRNSEISDFIKINSVFRKLFLAYIPEKAFRKYTNCVEGKGSRPPKLVPTEIKNNSCSRDKE